MADSRICLALFVAFVLGLSLLVPAEDIPETAYDESEALPYRRTPGWSLAVAQPIAVLPAICRRASRLGRPALARSMDGPGRKNSSSVRIFHSLTILDHSFRC